MVKKITQIIRGRVVSAKQPKTVTVLVESQRIHPMYKKAFARSHRYIVHDEIGTAEGDLVEIVKVRPISKLKHWQITKVLGKDIAAIVTQELKEGAAAAIAEVLPEDKTAEAAAVDKEAEKSSSKDAESSNKVPGDQMTKVKTKNVKKVKEKKA